MRATRFFQRYLLPGFVFQSVVIGGGYGTGRELAEFFLTYGPIGGLLAMTLISAVIWSAVSAVSFEFARIYQAYDYRGFLKHLLGRAWVLFEISYVALLLIVLAVIAAAAGSMLRETFDLPYVVGVVGIMTAVAYLVFRGTRTIERFLVGWSFVLYAVYIVLFAWSVAAFGGDIRSAFVSSGVQPGWALGGVKYAAYSLALVPAILFSLEHIETRREALTAGLLTGPIAMIPAVLFYIAMVGQYPAILERPVPANYLLELLGSRPFQIAFQIVLFGTLVETGTGMIHAVNERVAHALGERGRHLAAVWRPATAVVLLLIASFLSRVGLIALIAKGYGTLTWAFLIVFVVPVLTWGLWRIVRVPDPAVAPAE